MRLFFASVLCLLAAALSQAQTGHDELNRLREHLNLPASTPIALAPSSALPAGATLRLYVATGLDMKIRDSFNEWIEKWNKGDDGKKYGMIEPVADITQADVILSRYTVQESVATGTYSVTLPATVYDPATNTLKTTAVPKTYSYNTVPAYLYLLTKKGDGLEIQWREVSRTSPRETKRSGNPLREQFKKMMKARAEKK
jgi:hypothetical protein